MTPEILSRRRASYTQSQSGSREEALTEPDPLRAMLVMSELQVDTADLAPTGPNIERARRWLREVVAVLREGIDSRAI